MPVFAKFTAGSVLQDQAFGSTPHEPRQPGGPGQAVGSRTLVPLCGGAGPSAASLNVTVAGAKDTKLLKWLENCYPAVGTKRAAVDEFLAGIADAQLTWPP